MKALHSFPLIFVSLQNNKEPTFRLGEKHTLLVELGCSMDPSQLSFSKDIFVVVENLGLKALKTRIMATVTSSI